MENRAMAFGKGNPVKVLHIPVSFNQKTSDIISRIQCRKAQSTSEHRVLCDCVCCMSVKSTLVSKYAKKQSPDHSSPGPFLRVVCSDLEKGGNAPIVDGIFLSLQHSYIDILIPNI